ncbi:MAG: GGDEF domain-containing protein, partial [Bacilli bacterium]|nr:GGDEF domain-containing protein [Bacilli bacterium]
WVRNFKINDTTQIKEALEITTFVLGSQIGNKLLLDQLTRLSSIDILTGLYNRNKLNTYMTGILKSKKMPIGLVFLDINGLKKVNDNEGHIAGDNLIKRAAKTLTSVFTGNDIFRVGGDEFVVIIIGAEEEKIVESLDKLREEAKKNDVSFAAGYALSDNDSNIEKALKEADFNMYKDKRKFYNQ